MRISLIAAVSTNRVIGVSNQLPWHLPADLKFFKATTLGHHMVMGRKTWDSFGGKALPGRTSIVISRKPLELPEGVIGVRSLQEGLDYAQSKGETECMVIGGGEIFTLALELADRLYLTHVQTRIHDPEAILFPPVSERTWEIRERTILPKDEKHAFSMEFQVLERKNS
jgi:dihydrofolate reductase